MAEIPVEKKSSMSWLWILLLLLLLGALLWWLLGSDDDEIDANADAVAVEQVDDSLVTETDGVDTGEVTLAAILANPSNYIGKDGFSGQVAVAGPLTDRGFWIEHEGTRMFAIVIDEPEEVRVDLNAGQTITIANAMIRGTDKFDDIPGVPLDQDTINIAREQDAILVVDEDDITINEAA